MCSVGNAQDHDPSYSGTRDGLGSSAGVSDPSYSGTRDVLGSSVGVSSKNDNNDLHFSGNVIQARGIFARAFCQVRMVACFLEKFK